ncbi:hypothetical protein AB837_00080 [bacterium AB1]|nr:hypothetical protein AB837_00080 [bacterium AB1]
MKASSSIKEVTDKYNIVFDQVKASLKDISSTEREQREKEMNSLRDWLISVQKTNEDIVLNLSKNNQDLLFNLNETNKKLMDAEALQEGNAKPDPNQVVDNNNQPDTPNDNTNKEEEVKLGWGMMFISILFAIGGQLIMYKIHAEIARYLDRRSLQNKCAEIK